METKLEEQARELGHDFTTHIIEPIKRQPKWWREVIYVAVFYGLYSLVRNIHGSLLSVTSAIRHAHDIVRLEQSLHIFNEERIQRYFLQAPHVVKALNIYYGTAHFIVTIGMLLWLYFWQTDRYHEWRNAIFATTFLALIGYVIYPLAPPRFLPEFHFVDTLELIGGTWSFDSEAAKTVSNQYAAMPSLHVGWSAWCAFALMPVIRRPWLKPLALLYPALTILTIVVTGNHYWADVVGGLVIFALGYLIGRQLEFSYMKRFSRRRLPRSVTVDE